MTFYEKTLLVSKKFFWQNKRKTPKTAILFLHLDCRNIYLICNIFVFESISKYIINYSTTVWNQNINKQILNSSQKKRSTDCSFHAKSKIIKKETLKSPFFDKLFVFLNDPLINISAIKMQKQNCRFRCFPFILPKNFFGYK